MGVIRRQAKVATAGQQTTPREPVAGTSGIAVELRNAGSSTDKNPKDRGGASRSQGTRHVGGQNGSKILSGAQVNVVKTMVYITVCFTICWMPMYINILLKKLTVRPLTFHLFVHSFLPRDTMRKHGLSCRPVSVRPSDCLSVGPSVSHVRVLHPVGLRYRQDIVKLLSRPDSSIILVF